MEIPLYPIFRKLGKEDKPVFDTVFKEDPPQISEFTFTNLYSWRKVYDFEVSLYNGLILLSSSLRGKKRFFAPIGQGDKKQAICEILLDSGVQFIRIEESIKHSFEHDKNLVIIEDPDNADYLYKRQDLVLLRGAKYHSKRNLIRQFKSKYTYEYILFGQNDVRSCLDFEERWCTIKDCASQEGLSNERQVIHEMATYFNEFNFTAAGIKIKEQIWALACAEPLNSTTLVMHVLKADPNINGLYQVMMQEFLQRQAGSFEYVNLEQDLGIEGLRKSKLSYRPVKMVKKFSLSHIHR